jgi:hypothetical protein
MLVITNIGVIGVGDFNPPPRTTNTTYNRPHSRYQSPHLRSRYQLAAPGIDAAPSPHAVGLSGCHPTLSGCRAVGLSPHAVGLSGCHPTLSGCRAVGLSPHAVGLSGCRAVGRWPPTMAHKARNAIALPY